MKKLVVALSLVLPAVAFADWPTEHKYLDGGGGDFTKTYGGTPKLVLFEKDLDGKPVDADEVARRVGGATIGSVCTHVLRDLQPWAIKNGEPNERIMKAFSHVDTITCQYAHYFKGRDKEINAGTGTLPAGNPDDKNEPPEDCKLTFESANGKVKAIHIMINRHFDDPHLRDEVIVAAMKKQFPD
jgi:hypothetical protein